MTIISWQGDQGQEFSLTLDCTTREVATYENTVTEHPVETGVAISDHVRPNPVRLQLDGLISNAPHFLPADHNGGASELATAVYVSFRTPSSRSTVEATPRPLPVITQLVPGVRLLPRIGPPQRAEVGLAAESRSQNANVRAYSVDFDHAQECVDELISLRDLGTLLRVDVGGRSYPSMAIVVLETSRADARDGVQVSLQLKEIRFGETRTAQVPPPLPQQTRKAKGATAPKTDPNPNTDERSVLAAALKGLAEAFQ